MTRLLFLVLGIVLVAWISERSKRRQVRDSQSRTAHLKQWDASEPRIPKLDLPAVKPFTVTTAAKASPANSNLAPFRKRRARR